MGSVVLNSNFGENLKKWTRSTNQIAWSLDRGLIGTT
jgi:hypothetical protein